MSDLGVGGLRATRRPRHKHARGCLAVLIAVAVLVSIGFFAYVKGVGLIKHVLAPPADYNTAGHGSVLIEVKSGQTSRDIATTLYRSGVVASTAAFTDTAANDPRSLSIQAGCYRLHRQMSSDSALKVLVHPGSLVPCKGTTSVTIPEGKRAEEILALVAGRSRLSVRDLTRAYQDTSALGLPSYAAGDPEGYLFPSTYQVTRSMSATAVLKAMVAQFNMEAAKLRLTVGADAQKVSPADVVIIASLVQAEARRTQDMPKVASVIYNRLRAGMPLQLDSTLHYAVDSRGVVTTSKSLRTIDSPYNTYTRKGLPPTPIDSPGATALKAALHPANTRYRYFVTVNLATGETRFATTYRQHLRNDAKYQRYCQTSSAC